MATSDLGDTNLGNKNLKESNKESNVGKIEPTESKLRHTKPDNNDLKKSKRAKIEPTESKLRHTKPDNNDLKRSKRAKIEPGESELGNSKPGNSDPKEFEPGNLEPEESSLVSTELPFEPASLTEVLRWRAQHSPDKRAVTFLRDGENVENIASYAHLDHAARKIAVALREKGATGKPVMLVYPPGLDFLEGFLGCQYAGAVAVPVYPPEPSRLQRTLPRFQAIVNDSSAEFILSTSALKEMSSALFEHAPSLRSLCWLSTDDVAEDLAEEWREVPVSGDDLAFLQYTSGSTGTPKGVMVSHQSLIANFVLFTPRFGGSQSVSLTWLPNYHDMGLVDGLLRPLHAGCHSVVMPPIAFMKRPIRWLEGITRFRATCSGGPNFAYDLCVRKVKESELERLDLSSWTFAYNGAEPVRRETLLDFIRVFGPCGFKAEAMSPAYGLAEATLYVAHSSYKDKPRFYPVKRSELEQHRLVPSPIEDPDTIAMVSLGTHGISSLKIVDPETHIECPPERIGELWLAGSSLASGYWKRPEATEETFCARMADSGEGPFLRTGDLGFISNDGELYLTGRQKDLIIIRGRNHYPQDIELSVEKSHPALRKGCTAAFSVDVEGEEQLVVVQELERRFYDGRFIHGERRKADPAVETGTPRLEDPPQPETILALIQTQIVQRHELRPHAVVLIKAGSIPKTSSGKIQRRACKAAFQEGKLEVIAEKRSSLPLQNERPTHPLEAQRLESSLEEHPLPHHLEPMLETSTHGSQGFAHPPKEAAHPPEGSAHWLADFLAPKLGLSPKELDPRTPLANYGLDSKNAVLFVGELEQDLGQELPATLFYDYPTLEKLTAHLESLGSTATEADATEKGAGNVKISTMRKSLDPARSKKAGLHPPARSKKAGPHTPARSKEAGLQPPARSKEAGLQPPARSKEAGLHTPARSKEAGLHTPARSKKAGLHTPARSKKAGLHTPAGSKRTGLHTPSRSKRTGLHTRPLEDSHSEARLHSERGSGHAMDHGVHSQKEAIAIVGIGCRFPGADGPAEFWRLLEEGVDATSEVPSNRWDADELYDADRSVPGKTVTRRGGFLRQIDQFDPQFFGISPREAARMDPQQRLLLEVAWEALEDAGLPPAHLAGSETGVFIGISSSDYSRLLFANRAKIDPYFATGAALSIAANRLSYLLDLRGPSVAVDTACSSSLVAVHMAMTSLLEGESTIALAGGVNLIISPDLTINFSKAGVMAADGRCKSFDAAADGYARGEGAGVVVLKPLSRAIADHDRIYGVIIGGAVNSDGRSNGLMAPNRLAQQQVLLDAYRHAGVSPRDVHYIEAHGTGTLLGDPIEVGAIAEVIGKGRPEETRCAIGSVKSNIGHLESAAGIAGLIKVALSLKKRRLPASLNFKTPNPHIPFQEWGVRVQNRLEDWPGEAGCALAGVSAFGFGGTNAHLVLREGPHSAHALLNEGRREASTSTREGRKDASTSTREGRKDASTSTREGKKDASASKNVEEKNSPTSATDRPPFLLPLSARTQASLEALARRFQEYLSLRDPDIAPEAICYTASLRRQHEAKRLAVVARDPRDISEALRFWLHEGDPTEISDPPSERNAADAIKAHKEGSPAELIGPTTFEQPPRIAFLFPGQGPQWCGMGMELLRHEAVFKESLEQTDALLHRLAGWSLLEELARDEPNSRLHDTEYTQPALFAIQIALAALWRSWGIEADVIVGHSMGEVAAAFAAGALDLETAVRIIYHRGRLMARVNGQGAMAAIELSLEETLEAIRGQEAQLGIAANNGPQSCTISGNPDAVERLLEQLADREVFCRRLKVDLAAHSHQMEPLLWEFLTSIGPSYLAEPTVSLMSTVSGQWVGDEGTDAMYWGRNLRQPVLFHKALRRLLEDGPCVFLELSPHPALAVSVRQTLEALEMEGEVLPSCRRKAPESHAMRKSLARLYTLGARVDFTNFYPAPPLPVSLPTTQWERMRCWFESRESSSSHGHNSMPSHSNHPLLGWHVESPILPGRHSWELDLELADLPYLADHCVQGMVVFPATGHLELARAAIRESFGAELAELRDIEFRGALFLSKDRATEVQIVLERSEEDESICVFRIFSRPHESVGLATLLPGANSAWKHHVTGRALLEPSPSGTTGDTLPAPKVGHGESMVGHGESMVGHGESMVGHGMSIAGHGESIAGHGESVVGQGESMVGHGVYKRLETRPSQLVPPADFYKAYAERGIEYGPAFQGVQELRRQPGEAIARVRLPESARRDGSSYLFHPAFLDACLQVMEAALPDEARAHKHALLPVRITSLKAARVEHDQSLWSHARFRKSGRGDQTLEADLELMDESGRSIATITGLRVQRMEGQRQGAGRKLTYRLEWQKRARKRSVEKRSEIGPAKTAGEIGPEKRPDGVRSTERATPVDAAKKAGKHDSLQDAKIRILFRDPGESGQTLMRALSGKGRRVVEVLPAASKATNARAEEPFRSEFALHPPLRQIGENRFELDPLAPGSVRELLQRTLDPSGAHGSSIVFAWGLEAPDCPSSASDAETLQLRLCGGLLRLLQALNDIEWKVPPQVHTLSRSAQHVDNIDKTVNVTHAPLWGLGRSLAHEFPQFWGSLIDLEPVEDDSDLNLQLQALVFDRRSVSNSKAFELEGPVLEQLLEELEAPDEEDQIALRSTGRYVARLVPSELPEPDSEFHCSAEKTYLITGGLGALGMRLAKWLVDRGARHLALLDLTSRPDPQPFIRSRDWRKLETDESERSTALLELETRGAMVSILAGDVADHAEMSSAFERIQQEQPPIGGLIHAAGVVSAVPAATLSLEALARIFRPKVQGTLVLHELTRALPLDFFILFSSASGTWGSKRLAHYGAANHFLDAMAHYRRQLGLPALSVSWAMWGGSGMSTDSVHRRQLESSGLHPLDPDDALETLEQLLLAGQHQCTVASVNWPLFKTLFERQARHKLLEHIHLKELASAGDRAADERQDEQGRRGGSSGRGIAEEGHSGAGSAHSAPTFDLGTASQEQVETMIQREAARVLGLTASSLHPSRPLLSVGLDSLNAGELRVRIEAQTGVRVNVVHFLSGESISQLAARVLEQGASLQKDEKETMSSNKTKHNQHDTDRHLSRAATPLPDEESLKENDAKLDPKICPANAVAYVGGAPTSILLTGATGFLGAFVLEELLRRSQARIYCLVRARDEHHAMERIVRNLDARDVPVERNLDAREVPGERNLDAREIPVERNVAAREVPVGRNLDAREIPVERNVAAREVPVGRNLGAREVPARLDPRRVIPLPGDLALPRLGLSSERWAALSEEVDTIAHVGFMVNFLFGYHDLQASNVQGTSELLRLACLHRVKAFHFVSSFSVLLTEEHRHREVLESAQLYPSEGAYRESKRVSESLVEAARARGLPASIYRPPFISWHSESGVYNEKDFLMKLLLGSMAMGAAPEVEPLFHLAPVDLVARALVSLLLDASSLGSNYHILGEEEGTPWKELVGLLEAAGARIRLENPSAWRKQLRHFKGKNPLKVFFPNDSSAGPARGSSVLDVFHKDHMPAKVDASNTRQRCPLPWPEVDVELVKALLRRLEKEERKGEAAA